MIRKLLNVHSINRVDRLVREILSLTQDEQQIELRLLSLDLSSHLADTSFDVLVNCLRTERRRCQSWPVFVVGKVPPKIPNIHFFGIAVPCDTQEHKQCTKQRKNDAYNASR